MRSSFPLVRWINRLVRWISRWPRCSGPGSGINLGPSQSDSRRAGPAALMPPTSIHVLEDPLDRLEAGSDRREFVVEVMQLPLVVLL
jgi:hypothetical protein